MNFDWTPDLIARRDAARAFAQTHLNDDLLERDRTSGADHTAWRRIWKTCAEFGLFGLTLPREYGGEGLSVLDAAGILEAIGEGCADNGLGIAINGHLWAMQMPLLQFASPGQAADWMPGVVAGETIISHGVTEDASGSDAASLSTRAEADGDAYIINGAKTLIGMAPVCDKIFLFAATDPDKGSWGLSAFLVDADSPGITRDRTQEKMGGRTMPFGQIDFTNVRVPASTRIGPEGAGAAIFRASVEWERRFVFTSQVGAMARQLDECVNFARTRKVFGGPIAGHQSVSNRLANMKVRLETCRMLLYKAAWDIDQGRTNGMDAAIVKLHLSEAFLESSMDAVRIHGGRGYLTEHGVERHLRDSVGGVIYGGTSDIQREVISRLLQPRKP